jgi:hypothetical protein
MTDYLSIHTGEVIDAAVARAITSAQPGDLALTWAALATTWDSPPTLAATIAAGAVYGYARGGVQRYRLVPSPYLAAQDAFYSEFDGTDLSGLIVARG